jgi:hypothetical protein
MSSNGAMVLLSRPGARTRRLIVNRRRLVSATFLAVFVLASGFWAGWQIGKTTGSLQQITYDR